MKVPPQLAAAGPTTVISVPSSAQREKQGRNNKAFGKEMERRIAGIFGNRAYRVHDDANRTADVVVPDWLTIEVKSTRSNGPEWLQKAVVQREQAMEEEDLDGLIVFSCIDSRTGRRVDFAIQPLDEWLADGPCRHERN